MKKIIISVIVLLFYDVGFCQSIVSSNNSAGNHKLLASGTYEWSFGEMMLIQTGISNNVQTTNGILQPIKNKDISINDQKLNVHVSIFPNPATRQLNISISDTKITNIKCFIIDMAGKTVFTQSLANNNNLSKIDVSKLNAGTYILKLEAVKDNQVLMNEFKITKL